MNHLSPNTTEPSETPTSVVTDTSTAANPWGLEELDFEQAATLIANIRRNGYNVRVEERSGRDFLAFQDPDGVYIGPAELLSLKAAGKIKSAALDLGEPEPSTAPFNTDKLISDIKALKIPSDISFEQRVDKIGEVIDRACYGNRLYIVAAE